MAKTLYACGECGSERVREFSGDFPTGETEPDGTPKLQWREGIRCLDCGTQEEF